MYDISEQAARNLGRLKPVPVPKDKKKSKGTSSKIASFLLGSAVSSVVSSSVPMGVADSAYCPTGTSQAASQWGAGTSAIGAIAGAAPMAFGQSKSPETVPGEEVEWVEPKTAGTGIFSSIAEFIYPTKRSDKPWQLKVTAEDAKKREIVYTYSLSAEHFVMESMPPVLPGADIWDLILMTGPDSKLTKE